MNKDPVKILVVDDEPDIEALVRQKFRRKVATNEYAFVFASDGQQALETIRRDPAVDIVMTDINMPVMDGLTLLGRLNEMNRLLKIVIVSAYGDIRNIRSAMNRGAYDFLTKPIDFTDFELTIQKTIQELNIRKDGAKVRAQLSALEHELSIAARIQQSILPRLTLEPDCHCEVSAEMMPARSVGGDFYDFFPIGGGRLAFVIGDVAGKGVPAAIFMAMSRTLLRATAMQGVPAGECLNYVNKVLNRQCEGAPFVTVFYGILDPATGDVEFSVGAHNPPYILSEAHPVRTLDAIGGTLVGAFENTCYQTEKTRLHPGDAMFLFTDGVTEAENSDGDSFSDERLCALLEQVKTRPVREIVQKVVAAARNFSGDTPQADDMTLLALRYLPG